MDLSALGISQADVQYVQAAASAEEAVSRLEELKARARKNLRKLAVDLHPDRTGDDLVKTDRLKCLTALMAKFTAVQIKVVMPQPVVRVYVHSGFDSFTGSASTVSYTWVR